MIVDQADAPVAGVIVMLLDGRSTIVARALTNESGEFRVGAPQPGPYRLRTLRIGFRPSTSEPLTLAVGVDVIRRVTLADVPLALDTVRVTGSNHCSLRAEPATVTYGAWEQVRAALTAAQLTAGNRMLEARMISYARMVEPRRGRVLRQSARAREGLTAKPFVSLDAASLSRNGYVVGDAIGTTYYAPDIDVLLSDVFIDDHCLQITRDADSANLAIAFTPNRTRSRIPEIAGTVWIDRKTSELRRLQFDYVNIPPEQQAGNPGGTIDFVRLRNGAWMISRWSIRMPVTQKRLENRGVPGFDSERFVVREVRVEGSELTYVLRRGDTLWARPALTLTGVVTDSAGRPLPGSLVEARGSDQSAETDETGRFVLEEMLPGEYELDVRSPALQRAGLFFTTPFLFMDSSTVAAIRVPTAEQLLMPSCRLELDSGVVAGRVLGDRGPAPDALVKAEWIRVKVNARESDLYGQNHVAEYRADSNGVFRLCGLPVNHLLKISARHADGEATPFEFRIPADHRFATTDIVLTQLARGASLRGRVLEAGSRRPIAAAQVILSALPTAAYTDSAGRFELPGIPEGRHELTIRKIGFSPFSQGIAVEGLDRIDRTIELVAVQSLEAIQVRQSLIASFEEHRKIGQGHFITRAELAKAAGRKTSEILQTVSGLGMVRGSARAWVYSKRTRAATRGRPGMADAADQMSGARQDVCYSHVYIDNVQVYGSSPKVSQMSQRIPEPLFDVNSIPPDQIEAIEYYASPAQTPVRYQRIGSQCGVLVIHTRRPY